MRLTGRGDASAGHRVGSPNFDQLGGYEVNKMSINDIPSDQQRDNQLELLRAQRTFYRRAKLLQTVFLVLALVLPWVGAYGGADHPEIRSELALASIVLLLLEIGLGTRLQRDWVKTAARIQEQFDTEVFKLPWNQFVVGSRVDPEVIRSVTRTPTTVKQRKELEGWYEHCVGSVPLPLGRLICQRTNITYDMRVRKTFAWGLLITAILMVVFLLYHGLHKGLSISDLLLTVIVPFVPLAAFVLREHRKQSDAVESLTTQKSEVDKLWVKALKTPDSTELGQDSRNLQDAIYRNRTSNPLVYDWVYWLMRKLNEDSARHAAETLVAEVKRSLTQFKEDQ